MIIENVPYVNDKEEKYASCQGPPTVMMILRHFLPDYSIDFGKLYDKMNYAKGEWFFEMYMVELFNSLGIPSVYYSTSDLNICLDSLCFKKISGLDFNNEKDKEEFNLAHYNESIVSVKNIGLFIKKDNISVDFIKDCIDESKLLVATVNRNKIAGKPGFKGHFILIKGYNKDSLICNDSYFGEDFLISYADFSEMFYYIDWTKPNDENYFVKDLVVVG